MPLAPRLLGIASAVPPYALGQDEVIERVKRLFGPSAMLDRLLPASPASYGKHAQGSRVDKTLRLHLSQPARKDA